jgi:hypothetical protein
MENPLLLYCYAKIVISFVPPEVVSRVGAL